MRATADPEWDFTAIFYRARPEKPIIVEVKANINILVRSDEFIIHIKFTVYLKKKMYSDSILLFFSISILASPDLI